MIEIKREPTETEEQFLWRVGQLVDSGKVESWLSVNDIVNKELLGDDESLYRTESAWRKKYQAAKKFYEGCFSKMESKDYANEVAVMKRELERAKISFRDERNAWQKQNYADTRTDETLEILKEVMPQVGNINFPIHDIPTINGETDLFISCADLHIGQTFSSFWGEYNTDIAKQRLEEYLNEIIKIGKLHNASKVHVAALGDLISGSIHKTIQISNKENVIEQIKIATELISSFCYELTKNFEHVYFYEIDGNHSRLEVNKDNAVKDERLDNLIGWSICNLLKHIENFHDMTFRKIDSTIAEANIRNHNYFIIHGDVDKVSKAGIGSLSMMLGFVPEYIISGHLHTPSMNEYNGVTVYQSGSLAGSGDDYTIQNRLSGKPSQTVLVCNDKGVECCYNIKF